MSNGFVDTFERNGTTANMHDTDLRNTIGQANGLAQLDSNGKLPSSQMPSDTTKADKVNGATNGNLAKLDANGNLADSGIASSTLEAITNVYGSKNLLPFNINAIKSLNTSGTWSGNSYSYHNIIITLNENESVTINGTSDTTFNFVLANLSSDYINKVAGMLFSCGSTLPEGLFLILYRSGKLIEATAQGAVIESEIGACYEQIYITAGNNYSNVTIYPMIRDARISDSTYVPYAMTNKELTDNNKDLNNNIYVIIGGGSQWVAGTSYAVGDIVIYNNVLYYCIANNTSATPPDQRVGQYWKVTSIKELTGKKADNSAIEAITGGDQWVAGTSYAVGDIVIYNNVLYYCIANNTSATPPDQRVGQYWKVTSIKEIIGRIGQGTIGSFGPFSAAADAWIKFAKYTITTLTYNYMCSTIILPYGYHDSAIIKIYGGHFPTGISIPERFKATLADSCGTRNLSIGFKKISDTEVICLFKPHFTFYNGYLSILNISSESASFTLSADFAGTEYTDSDIDKIDTV